MSTRNRRDLVVGFVTTTVLGLLFLGCTPGREAVPQSTPPTIVVPTNVTLPTSVPTRVVPTAIPTPIPKMNLLPGDKYFSVEGHSDFIFSRNIGVYSRSDYDTILDWTKSGGSKLVRVVLGSIVMGGTGYTNNGAVDETWASNWELVFDKAEADGIYVLPVFSGWDQWNDPGFPGNPLPFSHNPLNAANGGPAKTSGELFLKDSPTQKVWLGWVKSVVERFRSHKNIAAWEPYGEVNVTTGLSEQAGIDFAERAAAVVRGADSDHRPITFSLADDSAWPSFYRSPSIDFIQIHPYPESGQLDTLIIHDVRRLLASYNKPVLIGESGLSALGPDSQPPTLTTATHAETGIKHAIWAGLVSGAMNGRALFWEDGYGIFVPALGMPFLKKYADTELPAYRFTRNVDFAGFGPLSAQFSAAKITGAAVGNEKSVIGWFRDVTCEPPDWNLQPLISKQNVTIAVPGAAANWQVDFYNTKTGTDIISSIPVARQGNSLLVPLPDFTDDIAFRMYVKPGSPPALAPSVSTTVRPTDTPAPSGKPVPTSTDPIAGKWTGSIVGETSNFIAQIDLSIQPGCRAGSVCGKVTTPQPPCSGSLFLKEIRGESFIFLEQDMVGASTCTSGGSEFLQLQSDDTLLFRYQFNSQEVSLTSNGVLRHP